MATWRDVSRVALAFPETTEEHGSDGKRSWNVHKKSFAWERPLRRADVEALGANAPLGAVLAMYTADLEMKDVMIASDPGVFFTTPHFNGYPAVLVRLEEIRVASLRDALLEAWLARAPKRTAAAFLREHAVK